VGTKVTCEIVFLASDKTVPKCEILTNVFIIRQFICFIVAFHILKMAPRLPTSEPHKFFSIRWVHWVCQWHLKDAIVITDLVELIQTICWSLVVSIDKILPWVRFSDLSSRQKCPLAVIQSDEAVFSSITWLWLLQSFCTSFARDCCSSCVLDLAWNTIDSHFNCLCVHEVATLDDNLLPTSNRAWNLADCIDVWVNFGEVAVCRVPVASVCSTFLHERVSNATEPDL